MPDESRAPNMIVRYASDGMPLYETACAAMCAARANLEPGYFVFIHRRNCPDSSKQDKQCACRPVAVGYDDERTCEEIMAEAERMVIQ